MEKDDKRDLVTKLKRQLDVHQDHVTKMKAELAATTRHQVQSIQSYHGATLCVVCFNLLTDIPICPCFSSNQVFCRLCIFFVQIKCICVINLLMNFL